MENIKEIEREAADRRGDRIMGLIVLGSLLIFTEMFFIGYLIGCLTK